MNHILEINNLSFSYSDAEVLKNISFTLDKGDFLGIVGSNGAGKSTLIKLILGLLPSKEGEIRILGEDRKTFHDFDKLGYVSQKANSFNSSFPATVKEVIMANLYSKIGLFRRPSKAHEKLLEGALEEVGMTDFENRIIGKLSGGQQQKVFIARVLINSPELIFLDEPTVGVDAKSVDAITKIISKLNKKGITMMMTNHDTPSLVALANKLLVLGSDGCARLHIKSELTASELKELCAGKDGHHHA